jgi:hypothetical protein
MAGLFVAATATAVGITFATVVADVFIAAALGVIINRHLTFLTFHIKMVNYYQF